LRVKRFHLAADGIFTASTAAEAIFGWRGQNLSVARKLIFLTLRKPGDATIAGSILALLSDFSKQTFRAI